MTAVVAWLDAAQARADAATPGPWEEWAGLSADGERRNGISPATDAEVDVCLIPRTPQGSMDSFFIAAARTDLPAALAALRAVLGLADGWDAALPGVADDLRSAIAAALGVSEP